MFANMMFDGCKVIMFVNTMIKQEQIMFANTVMFVKRTGVLLLLDGVDGTVIIPAFLITLVQPLSFMSATEKRRL